MAVVGQLGAPRPGDLTRRQRGVEREPRLGRVVMNSEFALQPDLEHLVFDTIERAHLVESADALGDLFAPACARLGFSHIGTFSVREPSGKMIGHYQAGTTDRIWEDHYIQQGHFKHDAIVAMLPRTLEAVVWRDLSRSRELERTSRNVFDEAHEFGIDDGYVLPQHFTNGGVAATVLLAPHPIDSNARTRAATHILSAYFAMGVRKIVAPQATETITLSKRQRECLQWVRAGKSDWEIGEILKISAHTVREHIEAARAKLGVRTRTQAVIEAIQRKLITI
jgi:DNA-binding CsgD family transcriptional regulator